MFGMRPSPNVVTTPTIHTRRIRMTTSSVSVNSEQEREMPSLQCLMVMETRAMIVLGLQKINFPRSWQPKLRRRELL